MLKEGTDPKDVKSYRSIVITNILCKILGKYKKQEIGLLPEEGEKKKTGRLDLENRAAQ